MLLGFADQPVVRTIMFGKPKKVVSFEENVMEVSSRVGGLFESFLQL